MGKKIRLKKSTTKLDLNIECKDITLGRLNQGWADT